MSRPPRLAEWILSILLPEGARDELLGDLAERFGLRADRGRGRVRATLWYWSQVLALPLWAWSASLSSAVGSVGDLRLAARTLVRRPGYLLVAVPSLALGIGANTALVSAMRSLLYARLPVDRPEELVMVYRTRPKELSVGQYNASQSTDPADGATLNSNYSYPLFQGLQAASHDVPLVAYTFARDVSVVGRDRPAASASGLMVSGNYFDVIRPPVRIGRGLVPADDAPGAAPVAVLGHAFWMRALGGDPDAVGSVVTVNGSPVEVVGVTEPSFVGLSPGGFFPPTDITVPLSMQPLMTPTWRPEEGSMFTSPYHYWLRLMGRVPRGQTTEATLAALTSELRAVWQESGLTDGTEGEVRFLDGSRGLDSLRRSTARPLWILSGLGAALLLIVCVNLATVTLARGAMRARELAIRRALGASRRRTIQPLAAETLLVAVLGGLLGVLMAVRGAPFLTAALTAGLGPVSIDFSPDFDLLATALALTLGCALAAGVLPALWSARSASALGARAQGSATGRRDVGRWLIVAQIGVSMPLVVGAGLFLRTLANLSRIDLGFDPSELVLFRIDPTSVTDDPEESVAIYDQVADNLRAIPGVRSVSMVENALMSGWTSNTRVVIDGTETSLYMNAVGPDFFSTMDIPLLAGRTIERTDDSRAPRVAIVNQAAADRYFGGNALGRRFSFRDGPELEIVGVAADTRYESARSDVRPTFFDAARQRTSGLLPLHVVVRTAAPAASLEASIREAVAHAHPQLPVNELTTQSALVAADAGKERVFSRLLSVLGGFSLLLACIGLHGITAFAVSRRTSEMGVRLALGAAPGGLMSMVLRRVLRLTALGLGIGLVVAYLTTPVAESMLYGIAPRDPWAFATAALVMAVVAGLAGWLPARRAARTDPVESLAAE